MKIVVIKEMWVAVGVSWFVYGGGMVGSLAASSGTPRELNQTPTCAVAGVCTVIILISILLEKFIHKLGSWLNDRHKRALVEALEKVKAGIRTAYISQWIASTAHLIFFLAVFHVIYSFLTMMLGRLKIRAWKEWEKETLSHDYEFSNDPSRIRLTHETSFVRAHISLWTRIPVFFYIGCFLRQFFMSVTRTDYLTLRNGFITVHLDPGSKFNFQKYIKRSLEDDFKVIVGVSPVLWASFVVFLFLNVKGWQALFWASLIQCIIILAVGAKLQAILTRMALEITDRHAVVQGMPLVQGSDKHFWFSRPQLIHLIHFALFQNAFQITYFLWIWYSFGLKSCFHANFKLAIVKVALGIGILFLCSYVTRPLYALVTQMGSCMKKSIFDEQTSKALKKWHMGVKKKHGKGGKSPVRTLGRSASPSPSTVHSPAHTLYRFKTTGHSTRSYTYDDHDVSDMEAEALSPDASTTNLTVSDDQDEEASEKSEPRDKKETSNEDEFSFVKPDPPKEP